MWSWLAPILIKVFVPIIVDVCKRLGLINAAEAWAAKLITETKTYAEPEDFPLEKGIQKPTIPVAEIFNKPVLTTAPPVTPVTTEVAGVVFEQSFPEQHGTQRPKVQTVSNLKQKN